MKPEKRQERILGRLRASQKEWRVEELASALKVSPLTIRRDLDQLESAGAILRTHGGCVYAGRKALDSFYHCKVAENFELKAAIGRAASREVRTGDTLMINDGSTCFHLAANLADAGRITVYTNSIAMIPEFSRLPHVRLFITGGEYNRAMYLLSGSLLERVLETVTVDKVFLGADAVDPAGRCLVRDQESARYTQVMMRCGRRKILLADHTKLAQAGHAVYGALRDFDLWITTGGLTAAQRRNFGRMTKIKEV